MIRIEFNEPTYKTCECCGNTSTGLVRYVYLNDYAHAIYYASFTPAHDEKVVHGIMSIGAWEENSTPDQRTAFPFVIWIGDRYNVTMVNADECPWQDTAFLGKVLNRNESLTHDLIKDVYHITDHIVAEDIEIKNYLENL